MSNIMKSQVHGFVISYKSEIYENVELPFLPLDNLDNQRPDWQEYWPIRKFLLNEVLREDNYYGFFSPRFEEKTKMSAAQLLDYVTQQSSELDVIGFSPQPDMGAFFLNVFEQNELFDPGFKKSSQNFCDYADLEIDISHLVMDSRSIIFSNYFFAKPKFWRAWLNVCEFLYNKCESNDEVAILNGWLTRTSYRNGIERKVFLMERVASLLISTKREWRVMLYNPFLFPYSATRLSQFPEKAVICDALKIAFNETRSEIYLNQYSNIIRSL
jgi:hypothetical protein